MIYCITSLVRYNGRKGFLEMQKEGEFFKKGGKWEKEDIRIFRRSDVQIGVGRRESEHRSREKEDIRMFRRLDVQKGVGRKKTFGYSDARMFRKESGDGRSESEDRKTGSHAKPASLTS
ncbi:MULTISPECIES: hypothetical protein [unclassified Imperialibacter]|uniref:hypothetical protein n=1 Tax=unclassified Imperialibacter TaxID=2629706 RepID=UPI00125F6EA7|nr:MULTISPECIES: hypothetical protein [unclassified Imperialibacter]